MEDKITKKDVAKNLLYYKPLLAYYDTKERIQNRRRLTNSQKDKLILGAIAVPSVVIVAASCRTMYKVVDLGIPFEDQYPKLAQIMYK